MTTNPEETLDPEDWNEVREMGHRMVDDMVDYLSTVRTRPAWQRIPEPVRQALSAEIPRQPASLESVYEEFKRNVLPYPTGNIHPRFWGWVMGTGTPVAMLADMLASGMNSWLGGFEHSGTLVEQQVLQWLAGIMRFPRGASGVLTGGCTAANIIGLAVARHARAPFDVRQYGVQPPHDHSRLVVYCSTETHSWVNKGVELLGIGSAWLRRIAVDAAYRIRVDALREQITADRDSGLTPLCVIGTAGTVNTGATDDLLRLSELCRREGLWFHVDGAFGALALLSPKWCYTAEGIWLADSLAFDLHKWMYMPFEVGCILVRDGQAHQKAFSSATSYMKSQGRGVAPQPPEFVPLGIDMARGFKALKIWMCLKTYGIERFGRLIEQNIDQAHYLASVIQDRPALELLAPVDLNVVCFRYVGGATGAALNAINEEIVIRLQESGTAVPSMTTLHDRLAIRVAITNHRSRRSDFDALVDEVIRIGGELTAHAGRRPTETA